jgi:hypothetical protein
MDKSKERKKERKRPVRRFRHRWKDYTKMDLRGCEMGLSGSE